MPKPTTNEGQENENRERILGIAGARVETQPRQTRRKFTAADKLRIVRKADACLASGERGAIGALLREEGIYSSTLCNWRAQLKAKGTSGLDARPAGRKPKLDAKDREYAKLLKRNAALERKLYVAEALIALQKKAHEILGIALPTLDDEI